LTSFHYYNFYGNQITLLKDIAGLLARCPSLTDLGLGMASDAECDCFPVAAFIRGGSDFLEGLCRSYQKKHGGRPLDLTSLKLGHGFCIFDSKYSEDNYLALLCNLEKLRTLHIWNGLYFSEDTHFEVNKMELAWDLLMDCTSLHQVSLSRLGGGATYWLNKIGSVRELYLSGRLFSSSCQSIAVPCSHIEVGRKASV
jgi:hypothetical protein